MAYKLNRTDGELLVDLVDGVIDTTTTDLTLVGRNYTGFGEYLNENYIKLLENFAATSAPANPLTGQLWYDKQDQRLKIYDGTSFRSATGSVVSSSQPSNLVSGDIWIDNENNKLYLFDGTDLVLVGPEYDVGQGKSGFEVASVIDTTDVQHTVLKLFLGGTLVGIYAPTTFRIPVDFAIPGYPQDPDDVLTPKRQLLEQGFNVVEDNFFYRGTASNAKALVDDAGVERTSANFLPTDANGATTGSLRVKNSAGVSVGVGDTEYVVTKIISGTTSAIETQQADRDFTIRVRSGSSFKPAIYVDSSSSYLGLWKTNPSKELDVTGSGRFTQDLTVDGNLLVGGTATYLNTQRLTVEDKNIELGLLDDSTEGDDSVIDGGGITLRSSDGSKDISWELATQSWTFNQDVNIISSPNNAVANLKFDGTDVLSKTTLGTTVTSANGLTSIGTLTELTVDDINLNSATISRINGTGLNIVAGGDIVVDSQKITGVSDPTSLVDVATKNYVDTQNDSQQINLSFDITGLSNPNPAGTGDGPTNNIATLLESMVSASSKENGTIAKVFTVTYDNSTVSGINVTVATDSTGTLQKSFESVDDNPGPGSTSVVKDITAANTASGTVNLTVNRYIYTYTKSGVKGGGTWTFTSVASA